MVASSKIVKCFGGGKVTWLGADFTIFFFFFIHSKMPDKSIQQPENAIIPYLKQRCVRPGRYIDKFLFSGYDHSYRRPPEYRAERDLPARSTFLLK